MSEESFLRQIGGLWRRTSRTGRCQSPDRHLCRPRPLLRLFGMSPSLAAATATAIMLTVDSRSIFGATALSGSAGLNMPCLRVAMPANFLPPPKNLMFNLWLPFLPLYWHLAVVNEYRRCRGRLRHRVGADKRTRAAWSLHCSPTQSVKRIKHEHATFRILFVRRRRPPE